MAIIKVRYFITGTAEVEISNEVLARAMEEGDEFFAPDDLEIDDSVILAAAGQCDEIELEWNGEVVPDPAEIEARDNT